MLDFLKQIVSVISVVFDGILSTLQATVTLFLNIPKFVVFITSSVALLPPVLVPFIVFGVTASVLLLILGRN
mgnify:CR=1 FL=1|jgi:hypothetical protein